MAHKHAIAAVLLLSAGPFMASASGSPRKPPPDEQVSKELLDLRMELIDAGRDRALSQMNVFRPLCDEEGYPLVGNLGNKQVYQPSQFCADVRRAGK
jgi:hypothetical protein